MREPQRGLSEQGTPQHDVVTEVLASEANLVVSQIYDSLPSELDFLDTVSLRSDLLALVLRDFDYLFGSAYAKTWDTFLANARISVHLGPDERARAVEAAFVARESSSGTSVTKQFFSELPDLLSARSLLLAAAYRRFLHHLAEDRSVLASAFGITAPVAGITGGLSDPHRGGQQVLLVTFDDKSRVIYKPRSVAPELLWREWCCLINKTSRRRLLFSAESVDRGSYGWMDYISSQNVTGDLTRLTSQTGTLLAALSRLGSTDVHLGNLIFGSDGPVLIDCETVLSPGLEAGSPVIQMNARREGWKQLADSALSTAGVVGHLALPSGSWKNVGPVSILSELWREQGGSSERFLAIFSDGYVEGNLAVDGAMRRSDWESALGTSTRFRYLPRRTRAYARVLRESVRPDVLRSRQRRRQTLDKLDDWIHRSGSELVREIIANEKHEIDSGDVPYFTVDAISNVLYSSSGRPLGRLTGEPALARAKRKLAEGGMAVSRRQLSILGAALRPSTRLDQPDCVEDDASDDNLSRIGRRVLEDCLAGHIANNGTPLGVVGATFSPHSGTVAVGPLTRGLYSGLSGLLLCYASYAHILGDNIARRAARDTARTLRELGDIGRTEALLGFTGAVSDFYALSVASRLIPDSTIRDAMSRLESQLLAAGHPDHVQRLDVVGGIGGALLALTALYGGSNPDGTRELVCRMLRPLQHASGRLGSPTSLHDLGMAHGRLGMAFAGFRGAQYLGGPSQEFWMDRLLAAGRAVLARAATDGTYASVSWCRGVAGLVSALLDVESRTGERFVLTDKSLAWLCDHWELATGRTLCCGQGSLADVVATLHRPNGDRRLQAPLRTELLRSWLTQPQNPRLPQDVTFLGAMHGSAGTAYTLLRLTSLGHDLPSLLSHEGMGRVPHAAGER